jgi:hypothetical protein
MFERNIAAEKGKTHLVCPRHIFGKVTILGIIKRDNMLILPNFFVVNNGLRTYPSNQVKNERKM